VGLALGVAIATSGRAPERQVAVAEPAESAPVSAPRVTEPAEPPRGVASAPAKDVDLVQATARALGVKPAASRRPRAASKVVASAPAAPAATAMAAIPRKNPY
jgi:hypothetical protein